MIRVAVLGAGGLGKAASKIISMKHEMVLSAICDSRGFAFKEDGLDGDTIYNMEKDRSIGEIGKASQDSIGEIINLKDKIDGVFIALPNLPNTFIPDTVKRFIEGRYRGVFVDVLKRTSAMEWMFELNDGLKEVGSTYITGCGATPGLLSAAASLASQSYMEIEKVEIFWGVGISNWDAYKATIREDIAHLPGFTVEKARALSDEEVERLLDERDGILEFHNMEHADDILLERVGVVASRDKVEVGGVLDTRHAKKPVSTTVTVTGITFDGKRSSHRFVLGDETSMAANVIGPALGYMKKALWLNRHGIYGIFGSAEFMPLFVR
ncbi:MAG: saccharopine dehydrogenase-like oxidoreductase [bacterium]|nr:saccharopine dehydrogenase-like oxidoreductase [bacterium]